MRKQLTTLVIAGTAVAGLVFAPSAEAVDDSLTVTVVVPGGGLTVDAGTDATISDVTSDLVTTVSGNLSTVTVQDSRNLTAGWLASASVGTLTRAGGTETILGAQATVSVDETDTSSGLTSFTGATAVGTGLIGTAVALGNNEATFTPSMSVVIPVDTAAGDYTGTVTVSVI